MSKILEKINKIEENNWWFISRSELIEQLVNSTNKEERLKILDIGCGTGGVSEIFNKDHNVIGLDSDKDAIEFASKRGIKVKRGNAENLPFEKESFDIVLCLDVIEHTNDDKKVVNEIYRVLKKGGNTIIAVPAFNFLWGEADDLSFHKRRYTKNSILKLLNKFIIIKCTYWNFFLFFPTLIFKTADRLTKPLRKKKKSNLYNLVYSEELRLLDQFNEILKGILRIENRILKKRNLPLGVSLVAVCEK